MIKCMLDEDDCIDLETILRILNQIGHDQAWALCYQIAALMQRLAPASCAPIESIRQIYIHKDGFVHDKSCLAATSTTAPSSSPPPPPTPPPTAKAVTTNRATCKTPQKQKVNQQTSPKSQEIVDTLLDVRSNDTVDSPPNRLPPSETTTIPETVTTNTQNPTSETKTTTINHHRHRDYKSHEQETQFNHNPEEPSKLSQERQNHQHQRHAVLPTPPITPELNEVSSDLRRRSAINETELVASLGVVLFCSLDYGIPDDEERNLPVEMEYLILQAQNNMTISEVLEICVKRLPEDQAMFADSHYREICKSLVTQTIELSIFLEKIYTASIELGELGSLDDFGHRGRYDLISEGHHVDDDVDELDRLSEPLASLRALKLHNWARRWMQVIRELRQRSRFQQAALLAN